MTTQQSQVEQSPNAETAEGESAEPNLEQEEPLYIRLYEKTHRY